MHDVSPQDPIHSDVFQLDTPYIMKSTAARRWVLRTFILPLIVGIGVSAQAQHQPSGRFAEEPAVFGAASIGYGDALAIWNDELLVGEKGSALESGLVLIYQKDPGSGAWIEADRIVVPDGRIGTGFGAALAVDGNQLIVGAPSEGEGAAYVYLRDDADGWILEAKLVPEGTERGDRTGTAVAIGGNTAALSDPNHGRGVGAVYIFQREDSASWHEEARFTGASTDPRDHLGRSLAARDGQVLAGSPNHEQRGLVHVYQRDSTGQWTPQQELSGDTGEGFRRFGQSIFVEASRAYIGDSDEDFARGALYVFQEDNETGMWYRDSKLVPPPGSNQWFGFSTAVDGNVVAVSAPLSEAGQGAIYVYRREEDPGTLQREDVLSMAGGAANDQLGYRVAISGSVLAASVPSRTTADPSVVVFERDSSLGTWSAQAELGSSRVGPDPIVGGRVACRSGMASAFPCERVDLLAYLPIHALGGAGRLNDVWGWTDPQTGGEYAIVGRNDGTAFVDVTDPINPLYLGVLPTQAGTSLTRDVKVIGPYALVVADVAGNHGMQIFDLRLLRGVTGPPTGWTATAHYTGIEHAHNLVVNEETGFVYIVGSETCAGGLHIVDMSDPLAPQFAGCFEAGGYVHDAQCVFYRGPDVRFQDREICINSSVDDVVITDVTDKSRPVTVAAFTYPRLGYVHQGWLTEDHRYFFLDDEGDEFRFDTNTRTLILDLEELDAPRLLAEYTAGTTETDHNQYVVGSLVFQANYEAGMRILDIQDVAAPVEIGFFDTTPGGGMGAWSVYPFFSSGTVAVSSIDEGLFLLASAGLINVAADSPAPPTSFSITAVHPNPFSDRGTFRVSTPNSSPVLIEAFDLLGRRVRLIHDGMLDAGGTQIFELEGRGLPTGIYLVRAKTPTGSYLRQALLLR